MSEETESFLNRIFDEDVRAMFQKEEELFAEKGVYESTTVISGGVKKTHEKTRSDASQIWSESTSTQVLKSE